MSTRDVIAGILFEYSGSGQGVDEMLAEIATAQADAIISGLEASGRSIVHKDEIHAPSVERLDELESVLAEIRQWCEAYPISVFPEPDFAKVRELLAAGGITLDAVSASNMRHVVNSISKIIDAAALREIMKEVG